jgi:hypothetical protein
MDLRVNCDDTAVFTYTCSRNTLRTVSGINRELVKKLEMFYNFGKEIFYNFNEQSTNSFRYLSSGN